jgi:DeoR family fructose operon transcriptional repressor
MRVAELSSILGVSEVTIRNDLELLAHEGLLVRDHGGAIARTHTALSVAFDQRARSTLKPSSASGKPPPPWSSPATPSCSIPARP